MESARTHIYQAAIELFNERGYHAVSLRDIASAAGTTIGNLTYHFPRKEHLIAALVDELLGDYSLYFSAGLSGGELLAEVVDSFRKAEENRERYPFYYRNLNELASASLEIAARIQAFQKDLYDHYVLSLRVLRGDGLVRQDAGAATLHLLACALISVSSDWDTPTSPYSNALIGGGNYSETCRGLLASVLTDEGLALLGGGADRPSSANGFTPSQGAGTPARSK